MDVASHRAPVAKALLTLETTIRRLTEALSHRPVIAHIEGSMSDRSAIRCVCEAYSAIDYAMDEQVGDSVVCLGVVGVNAELLQRALAVNAAKAELKALFAPLQRVRIRIPVKGDTSTKALPALRVILRNIQRSDLNIHAAYRKIPILDAPPAKVSYTRAHTRSVYRKSIDEIADMLAHIASPAAFADRELLNTLERGHTHLALVRYRYENIRANILYTRLDPKGRGRIQIGAELPLIYATGRSSQSPQVHFPTQANATTNPQRIRESKLEPQPFLQSLPVYRYAG